MINQEQWINGYYKLIFGLIYSMIGSVQDSLDLTQETFLTAYVKKDTLKDKSKTKYWLKAIAENKALSYLRKKVKRAGDISIDSSYVCAKISDTSQSGEYEAARYELQSTIDKSVMNLPDKYRMVVVLKIMCGFSQKDCADILCVPVTIINNRLHKAKQLLRKEFKVFMENSADLFDTLLKESTSKVKKVIKYFDKVMEVIDKKDFDSAEQLLLKVPALAADSVEAHFHIVSWCDICNMVEYEQCHNKRESLFILAEQEFKLAEKLDFEGLINDAGGKTPRYKLYDAMANIYAHWGKYDKALEYAKKSIELGNNDSTTEGEIYFEKKEYNKAIEFFSNILNKEITPLSYDRALLKIANSYKQIGNDEKQLEYMLKLYSYETKHKELIKNGLEIADNLFYIAKWYAEHNDADNMIKYLRFCFENNDEYKEWVKNKDSIGGAFNKFRDLPEFKALVGLGEGHSRGIMSAKTKLIKKKA